MERNGITTGRQGRSRDQSKTHDGDSKKKKINGIGNQGIFKQAAVI